MFKIEYLPFLPRHPSVYRSPVTCPVETAFILPLQQITQIWYGMNQISHKMGFWYAKEQIVKHQKHTVILYIYTSGQSSTLYFHKRS